MDFETFLQDESATSAEFREFNRVRGECRSGHLPSALWLSCCSGLRGGAVDSSDELSQDSWNRLGEVVVDRGGGDPRLFGEF